MSHKKKYTKSTSRYFNWTTFILLPIIFCIFTIGVVVFVSGPILSPIFSSMELFLTSTDSVKPAEGKNLFANAHINDNAQPESIPLKDVKIPLVGDQYGNIQINGTSIDAPIFYGDNPAQLNAGVGTYTGASLPGFGRTILMGAHNNTWFSTLDKAEIGSIINISTHYGTYSYRVVDKTVKDHMDTSAYDLTKQVENLILYTCYPLDTVGITPDRLFVYGEYVSGPIIIS